MHVCHLTSVHPRNDTRIFLKQCLSLSKSGFTVSLIVADGLGNDNKKGVNILDVGLKHKFRLFRFLLTTRKVYKKGISINADIYHFHDPELIYYGLILKACGKKVIYDVHEDLPRQIKSKPYLGFFAKYFFSIFLELIEKFASPIFDLIFTATPFITKRFKAYNINTVNINNYALKGELESEQYHNRKNQVCYVGGVSEIRGINFLVKACEYIDGILVLAGAFKSEKTKNEVQRLTGWKNVRYLGHIDRNTMKKVLSESKAGIVTFLPKPNHINAQPNKIFEYMSASLPIICSDFPLWKKIVKNNKCGVEVDPTSPKQIASAINDFLRQDYNSKMGENAKKAFENFYNWSSEEMKMINEYKKLK